MCRWGYIPRFLTYMVAAWDGEELVRERKNDEDCDVSRLSDAHRYQSRHTGSQTERWRLRDESRPWDVLFAEEGRVMREVLRRRDRRFYSTARLQHAPRQLLACKNSYGTLKNSLKKNCPALGHSSGSVTSQARERPKGPSKPLPHWISLSLIGFQKRYVPSI